MSEWKKTRSGWTVKCGRIRIEVTNSHIHNPGMWTMHAHEVGIYTHSLGLPEDVDHEIAKSAAILLVQLRLDDMAADLERSLRLIQGMKNDG